MSSTDFNFGLTVICRDNIDTISDFLRAAVKVFDTIVIVDTGSKDGTFEFLLDWRDTNGQWATDSRNTTFIVDQIEWPHDFSKARNYSLGLLRNQDPDAFMWLDMDDTFKEEDGQEWRRLGQELYNDSYIDTPAAHFLLPYHYQTDENGNVVVKQYRERIMKNPFEWTWKEPVHEVCVHESEDALAIVVDHAPVIHKPDMRPGKRDPRRNWNILHKHLSQGQATFRTLHYLQLEALERGMSEYSITLGERLVTMWEEAGRTGLSMIPGFFVYETFRLLGEAFLQMYREEKFEDYLERGEEAFRKAIEINPRRNEAKDGLVRALLLKKDYLTALEISEGMDEEAPSTITSVDHLVYGKKGQAWVAMIRSRYLGQEHFAVFNHVDSLDCPAPPPMALETDAVLRQWIKDNEIGIVILADKTMVAHGNYLRTELVKYGNCGGVILSYDTRLAQMAEHLLIYVGGDEEFVYREEPPLGVERYWFCGPGHDGSYPRYFGGVQAPIVGLGVPDSEATRALFWSWCTKGVADLTHFTEEVRATNKEWGCFLIEEAFDDPADLFDVSQKFMQNWDFDNSKVTMIVDPNNKLLGIGGSIKLLQTLKGVDSQLFVSSIALLAFWTPTRREELGGFMGIHGTSYQVVQVTPTGKRVAFVAGGVQQWDGNTPYSQGIGASESSVVGLAEQYAINGDKTVVFCPTDKTKIIGLVEYRPIQLFDSGCRDFDLLVSSRMPEMLRERRATKQLLWLHDVPGAHLAQNPRAYDEIVCDQIVCVSEWQAQEAVKFGIKRGRISVKPNGIELANYWNGHKSRRVSESDAGRGIWISQPERGLNNVLDIGENALEDYWVVYGTYNYMAFHAGNLEKWQSVMKLKHRLRCLGIKATGRIPLPDLRRLLSTVDWWLYPSDFPETFAVSAVEAVTMGVNAVVSDVGAIPDTMNMLQALEPSKPELVLADNLYENLNKRFHFVAPAWGNGENKDIWRDEFEGLKFQRNEIKPPKPDTPVQLGWNYIFQNHWRDA